jgi:hypothetical protein
MQYAKLRTIYRPGDVIELPATKLDIRPIRIRLLRKRVLCSSVMFAEFLYREVDPTTPIKLMNRGI